MSDAKPTEGGCPSLNVPQPSNVTSKRLTLANYRARYPRNRIPRTVWCRSPFGYSRVHSRLAIWRALTTGRTSLLRKAAGPRRSRRLLPKDRQLTEWALPSPGYLVPADKLGDADRARLFHYPIEVVPGENLRYGAGSDWPDDTPEMPDRVVFDERGVFVGVVHYVADRCCYWAVPPDFRAFNLQGYEGNAPPARLQWIMAGGDFVRASPVF
ncbi:hypothetical protein GGR52DRAFT_573900 [Hypoxylon sp. FL1284]|nr:hypothetical protein GGR52DRAFT_573900 [Hypoxylon sp. FL1284]